MSDRYEWVAVQHAPAEYAPPASHVTGAPGDTWTDSGALILGDPGGTALVVEGEPGQLLDFLNRARAAILDANPDLGRDERTVYQWTAADVDDIAGRQTQ